MRGFSFIELILVVALVGLLGAMSTPFLSQFMLRNQIEVSVNQVLGTLKKAQSNAIHNKNNAVWGMCVTSNRIRLFSGSCDSPTTQEDFTFPNSISINGLSSVTFSKYRGEPSATSTISVSSALKTKTIILNSGGGINVE